MVPPWQRQGEPERRNVASKPIFHQENFSHLSHQCLLNKLNPFQYLFLRLYICDFLQYFMFSIAGDSLHQMIDL